MVNTNTLHILWEKEQNEGWNKRKMVTKRKAETKERKKVVKTKLWKMVTGIRK